MEEVVVIVLVCLFVIWLLISMLGYYAFLIIGLGFAAYFLLGDRLAREYRIPEKEIGKNIAGVVIAALILIPLVIFIVLPVLGFFLGIVNDPWGFLGEVVEAAM